MRQLARLFLRGSRYNVTMKNLKEEDKVRLNEVIVRISSMPEMQPCREEFCRALSRTIGSDYLDPDEARNEFDIAVMRAGVTVLFHQPIQPEVWQDPVQIKKIFQQWVFNYLRQILRENPPPTVLETEKIKMRGEDAVIAAVIERLQKQGQTFDIENCGTHTLIKVNVDGVSRDCLLAMYLMTDEAEDVLANQKFVELVQKAACALKIEKDQILIRPEREVWIEIERKERKPVRSASFDDGDEDGESYRDVLEYRAQAQHSWKQELQEQPEWVAGLVDAVPVEATDVLQILVAPPRAFAEANLNGDARYDERKIAKFLNQDLSLVREKMGMIREACLNLGIGLEAC